MWKEESPLPPSSLYQAVSDRAFSGDRGQAKLAVLGAVYGQTSGDGLKSLAALRRRFPKAVAYVDDAARAGEASTPNPADREPGGDLDPRPVKASAPPENLSGC
ncbi:hypothetical protein AQJ46_02695 [Streptomyces canus]|uniref:Uncharacterized protein n=1 Tax=Streptomyces canus TaxID=58343 RepID=A0A101SII4_9ACTN|nr:hypothetical protein AQJ46_02695 [Streptomyces canus]